MCRGLYNAGQPCQLFIEAIVGIGSPAPNNARTIRFLIDTGATCTLISATDAVRLGLTYNSRGYPLQNGRKLSAAGNASGVGGGLRIFH